MSYRPIVRALSMVVACVALNACAPDPIEHAQSSSDVVSHVENEHHEVSGAFEHAAQMCAAPVEGAFPCAGGPRPPEAKPLETLGHVPYVKGEIATLLLPSEHIGCDILNDKVTCLVSSWPHDIDPNRDIRVPGAPAITLATDGPTYMEAKADAPYFGGGIDGVPRGQILPYGSVWFHHDFVFTSEHNGLTFWNVHSGHGALINADGFWPF